MPDDNQVGDTGNSVPAPLLRSAFLAESSEKTSEDHDEISTNGKQNVAAVETGQEAEVEQKQWGGE